MHPSNDKAYASPMLQPMTSGDTKAIRLAMQAFQGTGSKDEYVMYKENFQPHKNRGGRKSRAEQAPQRTIISRTLVILRAIS